MGPLHGVTSLREKHRYNITPWARKLSDDDDSETEEDERLAVAAAMFSMAQRIKKGIINQLWVPQYSKQNWKLQKKYLIKIENYMTKHHALFAILKIKTLRFAEFFYILATFIVLQ